MPKVKSGFSTRPAWQELTTRRAHVVFQLTRTLSTFNAKEHWRDSVRAGWVWTMRNQWRDKLRLHRAKRRFRATKKRVVYLRAQVNCLAGGEHLVTRYAHGPVHFNCAAPKEAHAAVILLNNATAPRLCTSWPERFVSYERFVLPCKPDLEAGVYCMHYPQFFLWLVRAAWKIFSPICKRHAATFIDHAHWMLALTAGADDNVEMRAGMQVVFFQSKEEIKLYPDVDVKTSSLFYRQHTLIANPRTTTFIDPFTVLLEQTPGAVEKWDRLMRYAHMRTVAISRDYHTL